MHLKSTKQGGVRKLGNVSPVQNPKPQNRHLIGRCSGPLLHRPEEPENLSHAGVAGCGQCNLVSWRPGKCCFPFASSGRKIWTLFWQMKECSAQEHERRVPRDRSSAEIICVVSSFCDLAPNSRVGLPEAQEENWHSTSSKWPPMNHITFSQTFRDSKRI